MASKFSATEQQISARAGRIFQDLLKTDEARAMLDQWGVGSQDMTDDILEEYHAQARERALTEYRIWGYDDLAQVPVATLLYRRSYYARDLVPTREAAEQAEKGWQVDMHEHRAEVLVGEIAAINAELRRRALAC